MIKHLLKFYKLSKRYLGTYFRYWYHDLDKLFLSNKNHVEMSMHHPKKYSYWYITWKRNNWEEICLNLEAYGGAQKIMYEKYPWAYPYIEFILRKWDIWKENNDAPIDDKDYIAFKEYCKNH